MSLPTYQTCCTICDKSWGASLIDFFQGFLYRSPEGYTGRVKRHLCWCIDCKSVCYAENFRDTLKNWNWYNRNIQRYIKLRYGLSAEIIMHPFLRVRKRKLRWAIEDINNKLEDLQFWQSFITHRKTPEKCLTCGGSNINTIHISETKDSISEMTDIHPGCGGKFYQQENDIRFSMGVFFTLYNLEGYKIDSEQAPWRGKSKFLS